LRAHTRATKLSNTRFSPALSKRMVSLVSAHRGDVAVAEFLVEDAVAHVEAAVRAGGLATGLRPPFGTTILAQF